MLATNPQQISRRVALKALRSLGDRWGMKLEEWPQILGRSRSTFYKWLSEVNEDSHQANEPLDADIAERLSHIVSIYNGLHLLFGDSAFADEWVNTPNSAFGESKPIQLIKSGHFEDLFRVRIYVDRSNAQ